LSIPWEAVEIESADSTKNNLKTEYDYSYLENVDTLIFNLASKGIYTMININQDGLSRSICGRGIPTFYANKIIENAKCELSQLQNAFFKSMNFPGVCNNFREHYNYQKDAQGNPLMSEC